MRQGARRDARIRELEQQLDKAERERDVATVRLAKHHFGDHGEECDDCGVQEPSEDAVRILEPLGIVDMGGSRLHGNKADEYIAKRSPS